MALRIHNTLTDSVEEFVPIEPGKVKMYVCGVTVYDDIHMGHARSIIVFDTVARYLRYSGYEVQMVTNFTDVDDKIIIRAAREGVEPLELSQRYIDRYFEEVKRLHVEGADLYPRASESIGDIIELIQRIIANGYGYVADDGSVYFDVSKVEDYGRLTNQKADQLQSSGRIDDPHKRGALDFALWKAAKPGEIYWESPWGAGRPGWHIECSAMIYKHMGEQIDIHGGGNDLIFPHHEDEILQTEAVTGRPLANYWMHNGMLQVKGAGNTKEEKMSKSLGNFFTVRDVLEKFDGRTVRFYYLNTHYMSPLVYGEDMLREADAARARLVNNYRELQSYAKAAPDGDGDAEYVDGRRAAFREAMDDDFNTREAIGVMFEMARDSNRAMAEKTMSRQAALARIALIREFDGILGIMPDDGGEDGALDDVMAILVDLRKELRSRKMYDLSDMIRDRLKEAGIVLEDSADGAKWKRARSPRHPPGALQELARLAAVAQRGLPAAGAGAQARRREALAEQRAHRVERREYPVPRARRAVLQLVDDVAVLIAQGRLPVGAYAVPVLRAGEDGVQQGLLLRDLPQRGYPGDQAGLHRLVRGHARQALHVPADEVHQHGLCRVVQVVAGRQVLGADVPGLAVHEHPAEHSAVGARAGPLATRGDAVHGDAQLGERADVQLHAVGGAEPPDHVDARGAVALYALVYRYGVDLHAVRLVEDGRQHPQGDHAVLPAGHRHRHAVAARQVGLLADLALDPPVDVAQEVLRAQVRPVVPDERDRVAPADVAARHPRRLPAGPPSSVPAPSTGCPAGRSPTPCPSCRSRWRGLSRLCCPGP